MPWDKYILRQFESALPLGEHDESRYYGPYNTLLGDLFPKEEGYMVVPRYKRPRDVTSAEFYAIFLVQQGESPVFFVEIKAAGHIHNRARRGAADEQMRETFCELLEDITIPILYGVSAMGTKLCFYTFTKETRRLEPNRVANSDIFLVDMAPKSRWDVDILTAEGEQRFRDIVEDAKRMYEQTGQVWLSSLIASSLVPLTITVELVYCHNAGTGGT